MGGIVYLLRYKLFSKKQSLALKNFNHCNYTETIRPEWKFY